MNEPSIRRLSAVSPSTRAQSAGCDTRLSGSSGHAGPVPLASLPAKKEISERYVQGSSPPSGQKAEILQYGLEIANAMRARSKSQCSDAASEGRTASSSGAGGHAAYTGNVKNA